MVIKRLFWQALVERCWQRRSILWLMGVRRVGKTSLCQSLPEVEYFDCERPRIRQLFDDPEHFLSSQRGKRLVFDEIHRLDNPSEVLKIAADHYPTVKIIATGSSTLGASAKFKDTLAGRKMEIWMTPLLHQEMKLFGKENVEHRFLYGGLPPFFMSDVLPESDFREWIDAQWAKDIQTLFKVSKRHSFQKFTELLLANSGGQFEANEFAKRCEIARQTILNYLSVLEAIFVVHIVKPFATHKPTEIVSIPKVYGFDTGFICYAKGWSELRREDMGLLWEHYVLNEIQAQLQTRAVCYWRDKQRHEIDFIFRKNRNQAPIAIECKWSARSFDPASLKVFRRLYPAGRNYVVANDVVVSFEKEFGGLVVSFVSLQQLIEQLK